MQLNVLNDLAEAMKALEEKKHPPSMRAASIFFPSNAFMALARSFNMFYCMLQDGIN